MRKKVANIVFNPFVNDSRVLKETLSLARSGFELVVLAHSAPDLPKREDNTHFMVKRFGYLDRRHLTGGFRKLRAYLHFAFCSTRVAKKFDIVHCNDLNTLPIGVVIKRFYNKKIKVVYDAHEYETETVGLSGTKKKLLKYVEKRLIKYADLVITVSDSIANEYVKLYSIKKPSLVLNAPLFQKVTKKNLFREIFDIGDHQKIFLYQGGLDEGRGVEILLETFQKIKDKNKVIVFMGYGALENTIKEVSKIYSNVYFHPAVSPSVLLSYTSSADVGISLIEDTCLSYRYCLPNKMFEYTMAGLPVIVSNLPEMKKIVNDLSIGVAVAKNNQESLTQAIMDVVASTDAVNIEKAKAIYNWENQEKILVDLYSKL